MMPKEILRGWEKFHFEHFDERDHLTPFLVFGLFMSTDYVSQSNRQTRTEVAEAVQDVAVYIRKQCVNRRIPLWPAIVPTEPKRDGTA